MAGFFVAGKINGGDKYGGLAEKPPHFTLSSKGKQVKYWRGKLMAGINMADWPKNHHTIPGINIPPKV